MSGARKSRVTCIMVASSIQASAARAASLSKIVYAIGATPEAAKSIRHCDGRAAIRALGARSLGVVVVAVLQGPGVGRARFDGELDEGLRGHHGADGPKHQIRERAVCRYTHAGAGPAVHDADIVILRVRAEALH